MEASRKSVRDLDCDEEDLEFFQKTIKVHERFVGSYNNRDEFLSEDETVEDEDGPAADQWASGCNSGLSSEVKATTFSMLDTVRSSCKKSGCDLDLDVLNLKSDEAGLGDARGMLLCRSLLHSRPPPFGDPLSEIDILDSALNLLDEKHCRQFRNEGLFDGLVSEGNLSNNAEKLTEEADDNLIDMKLDSISFHQKPTEPVKTSSDLVKSETKSVDVEKSGLLQHVKQDLGSDVPSVQQTRALPNKNYDSCSNLENKPKKKVPVSNLSVDDLVRYINGETRKRGSGKKPGTSSTGLLNTKAKKLKKLSSKKSDVSKATRLCASTEEDDRYSECGKDNVEDIGCIGIGGYSSDNSFIPSVLVAEASVKEVPPVILSAPECDSTGEEFTAVLHKRRTRTRKEVHCCDGSDVPGLPPKNKLGRCSTFPPRGVEYASIVRACPVSTVNVKISQSNEGTLSKRGSFSSLDEPPPSVAETVTKASCLGNAEPSHQPLPCTLNSYASVLVQNLPKVLVSESKEVTKSCSAEGGRESIVSAVLSSSDGLEPDADLFVPSLQSQTDNSFSPSSKLTVDEACTNDSVPATAEVSSQRSKQQHLEESPSVSLLAEEVDSSKQVDSSMKSFKQNSTATESSEFPLNRIRGDSGRSDADVRLVCDKRLRSRESSQEKDLTVFFDTRKHRDPRSEDALDIVFGFDPEIDEIDAFSNPYSKDGSPCMSVDVTNINDICFTGSDEFTCVPRLSEISNNHDAFSVETTTNHFNSCAPLENVFTSHSTRSSLKKNSVEASRNLENRGEKMLTVQRTLADGCSSEGGNFPPECLKFSNCDLRNSESATCIGSESVTCIGSESVTCIGSESVTSIGKSLAKPEPGVEGSALTSVSPSHDRFDLSAAQKFLNRAFENVLKYEHENPGEVLRL